LSAHNFNLTLSIPSHVYLSTGVLLALGDLFHLPSISILYVQDGAIGSSSAAAEYDTNAHVTSDSIRKKKKKKKISDSTLCHHVIVQCARVICQDTCSLTTLPAP
jgi:hypothetical protein